MSTSRGDDRPRAARSAEIAEELGADSLAYLSLEGVYEAVGTPREVHCDACFTGEYPLGDDDDANGKFALEQRCRSSRARAEVSRPTRGETSAART